MTAPSPAGLSPLLDQLDEARAKGTPTPWRWDPDFGEEHDTGLALTNDAGAEIVGAYNTHCCSFRDDPTVSDTDAALIVAAVNALPQLIRLAREREALRQAVEALADELDAWRENALRHARSCPPTSTGAAKSYSRAAAYQRAIASIRAAIAAPVAQASGTEAGA